MVNAWLVHVKSTMKLHPGLKLKEVLKLAKKSYKKGTVAVASGTKKVRRKLRRKSRRKSHKKRHTKKRKTKKHRRRRGCRNSRGRYKRC